MYEYPPPSPPVFPTSVALPCHRQVVADLAGYSCPSHLSAMFGSVTFKNERMLSASTPDEPDEMGAGFDPRF